MSDLLRSAPFQVLFEVSLQEYEKQTGITLAKHPLAEQLQHCDTVESVTAILQEQVRACSQFRDSVRIMKSLNCVVSILCTLSAGVNPGLPFPLEKAIYAGLAILLSAIKDVSAHGPLVDFLESIELLLKHANIYTKVPPTAVMTEIVEKTLLELLNILALATNIVKQGQPDKLVRKLSERKYDAMVLDRLDRLTLEEARITATQILEVVYGLFQNMKVATDDGKEPVDHVREALGPVRMGCQR